MVCQFRVRTCANRAGTTGDRVWLRLFERAIDAGARDLPHARNSRQTITASNGGRERLALLRIQEDIRRIRAQCKHPISCIGTSATMVSGETVDEQRKKIAEVATTLFGKRFDDTQVVN